MQDGHQIWLKKLPSGFETNTSREIVAKEGKGSWSNERTGQVLRDHLQECLQDGLSQTSSIKLCKGHDLFAISSSKIIHVCFTDVAKEDTILNVHCPFASLPERTSTFKFGDQSELPVRASCISAKLSFGTGHR